LTHSSIGLIIVAAGESRRMGGIDKVWAPIDAHPIVWYSLTQFGSAVQKTVVVTREASVSRMRQLVSEVGLTADVVSGGSERQDSVFRGLSNLHDVDVVAVHDCARPLASADLISAGVQHLDRYEGAVPVIPINDTVKRVLHDGEVAETLDRTSLRAVQTPQVFRVRSLRRAHQLGRSMNATDDASLLEACGMSVITFPGSERNIKVTTSVDLQIVHALQNEVRSAS
jgi:2-C-methyl-D-erythritol 4-phosphate cytidylyltransferase